MRKFLKLTVILLLAFMYSCTKEEVVFDEIKPESTEDALFNPDPANVSEHQFEQVLKKSARLNQYANIAIGKSVVVSDEYPDHPAVHINDGNDETAWGTMPKAESDWLYIDLGTVTEFLGIRVLGNETIKLGAFEVYLGDVDQSWSKVAEVEGDFNEYIAYASQNVTAQYVGILFKKTASQSAALNEVEILKKIPQTGGISFDIHSPAYNEVLLMLAGTSGKKLWINWDENSSAEEVVLNGLEETVIIDHLYRLGGEYKVKIFGDLAFLKEFEINDVDFPYIENVALENASNLEVLRLLGTRTKYLDVSKNKKLSSIILLTEILEAIILGENDNLLELNCKRNKLRTIDLSQCPNLKRLICTGNLLESINIANNSKLNWLDLADNNLSILDISKATSLGMLNCSGNEISDLNIGNEFSKAAIEFNLEGNKLLTEKLDEIIEKLYNWGNDYQIRNGYLNLNNQENSMKPSEAGIGIIEQLKFELNWSVYQ